MKPDLKALQFKCDHLVGEFCRSLGKCEICGKKAGEYGIILDWAHLVGRRCLFLRYDKRNYACLCRMVCHRYADTHPKWKAEQWDRIRGKGTAEKLRIESKMVVKVKEEFYWEIIRLFKERQG